ncbi:hypothetical protein [Leptolyngbya sp. 7M]|uniref:hypothetical protein n=1 Tax=Leptolyngbya sp. 7M TaxID=2812896 RepID=UPI001B8D16C5|nr:hypothetical protein [Leptolyngbya sp. 7M]QYO62300.1 hypothetical protein JVX88_19605 [Leptolyngbya sp. 7M]
MIRQGKVHYTKGILLAGVKDESQRQQLLEKAVYDSLSLSELKTQIKALSPTPEATAKPPNLQQRLTQVTQQVKKNKTLWQDTAKAQQLEALLNQLEELLMG